MNTPIIYYLKNEYRIYCEILEGMLAWKLRHECLLTTGNVKKGKVNAKVEFNPEF